MALIDWNDKFSVGIMHLDKQHMKLVNQINTLHDAMKNRKTKDSMDKILTNLINYTATHFKSEEKLFAQFGYEDSETHIAEHAKFVDEVLAFKKAYDEGTAIVSIKVMAFLRNWLINHILGSDMQYKSFFDDKFKNF